MTWMYDTRPSRRNLNFELVHVWFSFMWRESHQRFGGFHKVMRMARTINTGTSQNDVYGGPRVPNTF